QKQNEDYQTGDQTSGWKCLLFSSEMPQYYQYQYLSTSHVSVQLPQGRGSPPGLERFDPFSVWSVVARGDLDGDGVTSWYVLYGAIEQNEVVVAPAIDVITEGE